MTVLAAGSYTLAVIFTPTDTTTHKSATGSVSLTVQDFALNVSTAAGSTSSATVQAGGTATYSLLISPSAGTTFDGPITLSASGLPTGAVATFAPRAIASGAGTSNVTLTIQLAGAVAANHPGHILFGLDLLPAVFGIMLLPLPGRLRRSTSKFRPIVYLLLVLPVLAMMAELAGCGSTVVPSNTPQQQQPQSYIVTVTATSDTATRTTAVNLTVQ